MMIAGQAASIIFLSFPACAKLILMLEHITELGVGGIFALLVLQTVLPYLKERLGNGNGNGNGSLKQVACSAAQQRLERVEEQMDSLAASTSQMASILTATDQDGAPLVYGSTGRLVGAIEKLRSTIDKLAIKIDHIAR